MSFNDHSLIADNQIEEKTQQPLDISGLCQFETQRSDHVSPGQEPTVSG